MKAAIVLPTLLLQKPSSKSKPKEHIVCLDRRLSTWLDGNLNDLVLEGRTIQQRIPKSQPQDSQKHLARSFTNLMFEGKTKAAIHLLTEEAKGGLLRLSNQVDINRTVRDFLIDKYPSGQLAHPESLIEDDPPDVHPVLFESINASVIRSAALRTTGVAGPSGLDAASWRRQCTSFKSASNYGDTARRIIAKAILTVTPLDIQEAAGSLQLCAGQISGIEAVVHAVNSLFQQEETEAILLVDASNAFNSLNRLSALHNIRQLCPSLATALINSYSAPTELFVYGDVLYCYSCYAHVCSGYNSPYQEAILSPW